MAPFGVVAFVFELIQVWRSLSAAALIGYALLVREPRTGEEIHVRIRAFSVR